MDRDYFRYEPARAYGRSRRKKSNVFGWSVTMLLLTGFAFTAWLGSFYIFWQPERPQSYRILKKLHKIEPTKRFELTAAPAGEFLTSKQLYDRYIAMSPTELTTLNAELTRNYIRNFQQVRGLVPYVIGRFNIMEAHELTPNDLFLSGMVALTNAVDHGELLMEHVYPADPQALPLMKQTLVTGLEIKLERTHDLSAVLHAERLSDGRIMITAMPLLYGSYTVTRGPGTFTLEPPLDLNLAAGWPLFKDDARKKAETQYASYKDSVAPKTQESVAGLAPTPPPPAANELIRVEPAAQVEPPKVTVVTPPPAPPPPPTKPTKGSKKNQKATPSPTPARTPTMVAQNSPPPKPTPTPAATVVAIAKSPAPSVAPPAPTTPPTVAAASPSPPAASPSPSASAPDNLLASTAGGGNWKTFPPGKMPVGRLITLADLRDLADRGLAGERVYLKGQFVVNFTEPNRAVLRPKTGLTDAVLKLAGGGPNLRIIVDFPAGYTPPTRGSTVTRDEARPYEITEVRKQSDGQLNVFVREIMQ
jgi:outer membrane biosynthesis protein TonB